MWKSDVTVKSSNPRITSQIMSNTRLQLLLLASFAVAGSRSFILGSSWVPRSRVGVVPRAEPPNSRGDTPHLESGGAGGTPPSARPTPPPPQKPAKVAPKGIFAPVVEVRRCLLVFFRLFWIAVCACCAKHTVEEHDACVCVCVLRFDGNECVACVCACVRVFTGC